LGSQGENLSLWGPERFFSVVGIAIDIPIIRKSQNKKLQDFGWFRWNRDWPAQELRNEDIKSLYQKGKSTLQK